MMSDPTDGNFSLFIENDIPGDFLNSFKHGLSLLRINDKARIESLTKLAQLGYERAGDFVTMIIETTDGILSLYLMDSIIKTIGGAYLESFSQVLVLLFTKVFSTANNVEKKELFGLRQNRNTVFSNETLSCVDDAVNKMDVNWPVKRKEPINFEQNSSDQVNDDSKPGVESENVDVGKEKTIRPVKFMGESFQLRKSSRTGKHTPKVIHSQSILSQRKRKLTSEDREGKKNKQENVYGSEVVSSQNTTEFGDCSQTSCLQSISGSPALNVQSGSSMVIAGNDEVPSNEANDSQPHSSQRDAKAVLANNDTNAMTPKIFTSYSHAILQRTSETASSSDQILSSPNKRYESENNDTDDETITKAILEIRDTQNDISDNEESEADGDGRDVIHIDENEGSYNDGNEIDPNVSNEDYVPLYESSESIGENDLTTPEKREKKPREDKNWQFKHSCPDTEAAKLALQKENAWSIWKRNETADGMKWFYRCNKIKLRDVHCAAQVYHLFKNDSDLVMEYRTDGSHDHEKQIKAAEAKQRLMEQVENLLKLNKKPNEIMHALSEIDSLTLPTKQLGTAIGVFHNIQRACKNSTKRYKTIMRHIVIENIMTKKYKLFSIV